jgi:phosphatidylglycerol---prolipoprotein diacylglyceryl transferase
MTLLGFVVGIAIFFLAAKERRLNTEGVAYLAFWGLLGGLIGAKLGQWGADPRTVLDPRYGGRTILGGVLGGWLAVEMAKKKMGIRRSTGDFFALALAAGESIGRIGCYLNGCCYGKVCTGPIAVFQHGQWRHPTQLYSAAYALILFIILWSLRKKLPREGQLFALYVILWSTGRFVLEFLRTNPVWLAGLTLAQVSCIVVGGLGVVWWRAWKK